MMKKFFISLALLAFSGTSAIATCTQPSGTFAGTGSGALYRSGKIYSLISDSLVVTIAADGSGTIDEVGKNTSGRFTSTSTMPAIGTTNHSFNSTTCRGIFTSSIGNTFVYNVTGSGTKITFTYFGNDTYLALYSLVREKV